jgi:hypothetical protein
MNQILPGGAGMATGWRRNIFKKGKNLLQSFYHGSHTSWGIAISGSLSKNFCRRKFRPGFFYYYCSQPALDSSPVIFCCFKMATAVRLTDWFCLNYFVDEEKLEVPEQKFLRQ